MSEEWKMDPDTGIPYRKLRYGDGLSLSTQKLIKALKLRDMPAIALLLNAKSSIQMM
jgi:hypothetical protein